LASGARGLSADWNAGTHTITCAQISIPSAGYLNETSNDLQLVADTDDLRLISTVDDVLVQAADRVIIKSEGTAIDFYACNALTAYLTSAALYPASTNGAALGLTSRRWSWLRVSHIDAAGNVTVAGTLGVTGAATLGNTLAVTGAATLSSTLGVTGAATLASTLAVSGAATLGSTLAVTGAVTLSSTLNVSSTITGGGLNIGGEARCDTLRIDTLPGTYGDQTLTHCFPISLNGTTYRVPVYVP